MNLFFISIKEVIFQHPYLSHHSANHSDHHFWILAYSFLTGNPTGISPREGVGDIRPREAEFAGLSIILDRPPTSTISGLALSDVLRKAKPSRLQSGTMAQCFRAKAWDT